jgi:hypothetical protein
LLQKKLGFRMLMDLIPLDASLVKGSHGRRVSSAAERPLLMVEQSALLPNSQLDSTDVFDLIRRAVLQS